jgi:hypothetical protein
MKTLFIFLLLLFSANLYSQDRVGSIKSPGFDQSVEELFRLQNEAKVNGDRNKVRMLQQEIDSKTGTVTKPLTMIDGYGLITNESIPGDNININTLIVSPNVRGIATCTEVRGANIGRVWIAIGYSGVTGPNSDTIAFFRSDDGGVNFTLAVKNVLNNDVKLKNDQLDMEIIERSSGDKHIWLVRGMRNNSNGDEYIGVSVVNTTTNSLTSSGMTWPGQGTATNYYNPRIASDNEQYTSNPYVFITAALDSVVGSTHHLKIKYAQCNDPDSLGSSVIYNPSSIAGTDSRNHLPSFFQDIAFFRNGSADSLILINNNRSDSTSLTLRAFRRADALNSTINASFNFQPNSSNQSMFPKLATSGLNTVALVYRTNHLNTGDWDIRSYICKGGLGTIGNWTARAVDNASDTADVPYRPDIIGVKLGNGSFRVSYGIDLNIGMLKYAYYSAGSLNWQTPITIFPTGVSVSAVPPVAGYRFVSGDSAFIGYSGFNGVNGYSAAGSSGAVIGINPVSGITPEKFELSQNYPNPFNPSTSIKFAIPERTFVTLQIFDVSGRLVGTLVNENLNAGTYNMNFNGGGLSSGAYFYKLSTSSFTETKKMLLVK